LQVDLGGSCGEDSWFKPIADAFGWVDAYVERMLMAVILVKDEVEQRRFLVQPFTMLGSTSQEVAVGQRRKRERRQQQRQEQQQQQEEEEGLQGAYRECFDRQQNEGAAMEGAGASASAASGGPEGARSFLAGMSATRGREAYPGSGEGGMALGKMRTRMTRTRSKRKGGSPFLNLQHEAVAV
jgi:hypothetical protein